MRSPASRTGPPTRTGWRNDNPRFWTRRTWSPSSTGVRDLQRGCRLCFNLCPSFDVLFRRVDALDPHREEAEGKHIEAGKIVEEHGGGRVCSSGDRLHENPVGLLQDEDKQRWWSLLLRVQALLPQVCLRPAHEFAVDFPKADAAREDDRGEEDAIGFRERFSAPPT